MRFLSEIKSELKPNFLKKSKKSILNSCPIRFEGPANEHLYTSKVRVCRAILFLKKSRRFQICYAADPATACFMEASPLIQSRVLCLYGARDAADLYVHLVNLLDDLHLVVVEDA